MKMQPVSSSNINAIGYDEANKELHVEFSSGKTYSYEGVSQETYEAMRDASSVGAYFAKHTRGKFDGSLV
jgi:hypothetical protein